MHQIQHYNTKSQSTNRNLGQRNRKSTSKQRNCLQQTHPYTPHTFSTHHTLLAQHNPDMRTPRSQKKKIKLPFVFIIKMNLSMLAQPCSRVPLIQDWVYCLLCGKWALICISVGIKPKLLKGGGVPRGQWAWELLCTSAHF